MNWPLPPVLVVDDEKNMRLSLRSILSGEGYELRLLESAEEALAALEKEEFFMVITDARLGSGMSGYQFLALACKRWPNTPFLMITAYATPKLVPGQALRPGGVASRCFPLRRTLPFAARQRRSARYCHPSLPSRADHRRIAQHA
jgi:DNA-binding NtrC family response regulator